MKKKFIKKGRKQKVGLSKKKKMLLVVVCEVTTVSEATRMREREIENMKAVKKRQLVASHVV